MKKKIAIIGASYLQLPLYLKAKELEIETIGFAWEEGAVAKDHCTRFYPISILEKDKILAVCEVESIDAILTIATDLAVQTVSFVADKMRLVSNSINSSELSTNKFAMRCAFRKNHLSNPDFFKVTCVEEIDEYDDLFQFPLIVKPVDRSGSIGITKVFDIAQLRPAITEALSASFAKEVIVESFIAGSEISVETISYDGEHYVLALTDKVTSGFPHYVELEHHQPSLQPQSMVEIIIQETIKALNSLDIRYGASHVEFIIANGDIYITEVGARMGGDFIGSDLVFLSTGYDFLKGVLDVALGKFQKPANIWQKSSGIYFYSSASQQIGDLIRNNQYSEFKIRSEILSHTFLTLKKSSDRSGYFIYQSNFKLVI